MSDKDKNQNEWIGLPDMSKKTDEEVEKQEEAQRKKTEESDDYTRRKVSEDARAGIREGDTGLGQPVQEADKVEVLSEEEKKSLKKSESLEAEEAADMIASDKKGFRIPKFLFNTTFIMLAVTLGLLLLFYISRGIMSAVQDIQTLPVWARYIWYIGLSLLVLAIFITVGRLILIYIRLAKTPQIKFKGIDEISKRQELRKLSLQKLSEAKQLLINYVENYPVNESERNNLSKLGFKKEEIDLLIHQKGILLDQNISPSSEEWINNFRSKFMYTLEKCADRKIRSYSVHVGLKTAAAPSGIIDTLVVTYSSFSMIGDLCTIYNLRMNAVSTAIVLVRAFIHSYLAGEIEETFEEVSDMIFEGVDGIAGSAAGYFLPKVAEAKANGFLIWRLGKATSALLRPISYK